MFKYALLVAAIAAVLFVPASPASRLLAQEQPGASTGVINIPAADEMPDADDTQTAPADDENGDVLPPAPMDPTAGNAQPGGASEMTPAADEIPDDTPASPAPMTPAPSAQPAPQASEDVPLWKPGQATTPDRVGTSRADIEASQRDNIVLLIDRSASMGGYWAWARDDMISLIRTLKPDQNVHLILFGHAEDIWEIESKELDAATLERKIQATELLTFATPAGSTDPQAGFRRALEAIGDSPATIHFVSDGVFNHPQQVRRDLRSMTAGEQVIVHTHLYGDALPPAVTTMQGIAKDNDGTYVNATNYP